MHTIWDETAAVFRTPPGPAVHLAGGDCARHGGECITAACCGAHSRDLSQGIVLTPDRARVTCPHWLIWRSAVAYLGGAS